MEKYREYDDELTAFSYKNKMNEEEYKKLEPLFCVQSLGKTRIFCSYMRPLCLTKSAIKKLNIEKQELDKEIVEELKGQEVGILRRVERNGVKIDDEFIIHEGVIKDIIKYQTMQWASIEINNEQIRPERVFLLKK